MEEIKNLQYRTKANDVDEKGIVTVAVNGIGVKDSQNDISMPGSFTKTLRENMPRMRWLKNHDTSQLLGVPLSGEEKDGNLVMVGQLNLQKQIGRDTLADYKLFAEHGRTLEHSIGVQAIKRDDKDKCKVLEWKMWEYSTLDCWGSNPQTFLVGIKSDTRNRENIQAAVDFLKLAMKQQGYSDDRLTQFDMEFNLLVKSLNGANIVKCPYCGYEFDYDQLPEQTFSQQVIDYATNYTRWMAQDVVAEEMQKLKPEVQQAVLAIIDSVKKSEQEITEKSITDALGNYVRCPHCYGRVYKANTLLQGASSETDPSAKTEPSSDTQDKSAQNAQDEVKEEKADGVTLNFGNLNGVFK